MRPELRFSRQEGSGTHSFQLDRQLAESLSRRHVVLLDASVWNRLADGREAAASAVRSKLLRLKRSEEHKSELQSLMRISYAVFCLKQKKKQNNFGQTVVSRTRKHVD